MKKIKEKSFVNRGDGQPMSQALEIFLYSVSKVLKLHKSLYGLKQATRVWNETLNEATTKEGFIQSKHDECVFIHNSESNVCYVIVHVDDMIFSSNSMSIINSKKEALNKYFELKSLGIGKNYLGIEVSRDENGIFLISQENYKTQ